MADHVFISYAHDDQEFVLALANRLKRRGVPVWIDQWELTPGTNWERSIQTALYDCAQFLIVLSPAAVDSDEVQGELRAALNRNKRVLPVRYQDCTIPLRLESIQYIDYIGRRVEDRGALHELLQGLGLRPAGGSGTRRALWANRWRELELFEAMVAGESAANILLIESEGGMGKSSLLREYEQGCCSPDARCVPVDLKGSAGLVKVLGLLAQGLGWENLPTFGAQVAELAQDGGGRASPPVRPGRAALQVALDVPDEARRRFHRTVLTEALFDDLQALSQRLVFVFDTLDGADPEVREWLLGLFLESVRYSQNLVAVVAGRPPVQPRTSWAGRCECRRLQGIYDAQAWQTGLHDLDPSLEVPLEYIEAYCLVFDGRPLDMGNALQKVIQTQAGVGPGGR